ncbi:MAG TPA: MFS transporter [Pyrinomonadaceae bacterium]|nr:MFS transporter [Pyrinomonadaceae bacterium]
MGGAGGGVGESGADEFGAGRVGYAELLRRNRDFRQLWLGQVVSQLGDWFNTIAVYTLVMRLTGSGRAVGLVLVARFLPTILLGPLAGVVADRFDRRAVMIASDIARALVVLGFLFVRRPEHLWLVYALTLLQLALSTFFEPAKTAAIPSVVSARELVPANAVSSVTWSAMLTIGAAVGGEVAGRFGTDAAFVLDSVTYLGSALLIAAVRLPRRAERPKTKLTLARAVGLTATLEGIAYVRPRRHVLALMLAKPAWGLGGGMLSLLAVFGDRVFPVGGETARGIGVLYAARGVGTAIGPLVAARFAGRTRGSMRRAIGLSFLVGGVFYILFGAATNFYLALVLLAFAHMGGSVLWVFSTTLLQESVDDEFRGRVFAAEMTLLTLTLAASNYATGEALDRFGLSPRAVAVGVGCVFIIPGLVWFATARWWERPPSSIIAPRAEGARHEDAGHGEG